MADKLASEKVVSSAPTSFSGSPYRSRNNYRGGGTQNRTNETQTRIF